MSNSISKVLLIEDDTFISKMYSMKFANAGYTIDIAGDGEEGLAKLNSNDYDILILDLMLPKIGGAEVLEKLRTGERNKTIPVIVLTNLTDPDQKNKVISLNVTSFLDKSSLTPGQLVEVIKNM